MGELLLCNHPIAAMPYYLEALSLNIYSLEELCYVMEHHLFLPDEDFFDEELLQWIEREAGERELAEYLRLALRKGSGLTELVEQILKATGYLNREAEYRIIGLIKEMQHKSVFERRKMRADRYVENGNYVSALSEYRRILQMEEECRQNPIMCGNVWHNQGVVFARGFLFKEARECFETAYKYHMNLESIRAAAAACHYAGDDKGIAELAAKYGISDGVLALPEEAWTKVSAGDEQAKAEAQIEELFADEYETLEQNPKLMQMLKEWKMEYQKNGLF